MSADDSSGAAVRALAARLNAAVVARGQSLAALEREGDVLPARDRPLLRAMLSGSLRWHHRFDWQLGKLLDRPLKRRDAELSALLRIGLTQLATLRIPDHAAVSATVEAAAGLGLDRARSLVNAVLRRYQREREALEKRVLADRVARFSHPEWLIARMAQDWPDDWQSMLDANNAPPPFWLRVNRRRIDTDTYVTRLAAEGLSATTDPRWPDAVLVAEACPVEALPGFAEGLVSVQDAGAQVAARLMRLEPGQHVLDACAAPGGKTAHMLECCAGLGELVAVDSDGARLDRVASALARLGLVATLIGGDATEPGAFLGGRRFDRVLVDAPCSGTGVIRRHPDIKLLRRPSDIDALARTQRRLLDALWPSLEPGGRMVYVSCSVLEAENGNVVTAFAEAMPDARLALFGSAEHFQLKPGEANTDGFYYACLTKAAGDV